LVGGSARKSREIEEMREEKRVEPQGAGMRKDFYDRKP